MAVRSVNTLRLSEEEKKNAIASSWDTNKCTEYEWVPITSLYVEPKYQRKRTERAVRDIADNWNWIACGALIVARRPDGVLSIMEGSHRWAGATQNGKITHLPCMIWDVPTVVDEAKMFMWINMRRKAMKSIEIYRAGITAEEPACIAVNEMLRRHNYEAGSEKGGRNVGCVNALKAFIVKHPELCNKIFDLCVEIADGGRITQEVFRGLSTLELTLKGRGDTNSVFDKVNRDKLVTLGMDVITADCIKATRYFGKSGELVFARGIVDTLNNHRKLNRINPI